MLIAHVKAQMEGNWRTFTNPGVDSIAKAKLQLRQHWRTVVREVAEAHGITVDDLIGPRKTRRASMPRQEAMYRMRNETPLSYPEIGARLGGRDHSSIIHGVKAHAKRANLPLPL